MSRKTLNTEKRPGSKSKSNGPVAVSPPKKPVGKTGSSAGAIRRKREKPETFEAGSPTLITDELRDQMFHFLGGDEAYESPYLGFEEEIQLRAPQQEVFGELTDLAAVKFLSLVLRFQDTKIVNPTSSFPKLEHELAKVLLEAIENGHHEFFKHLALLVKMGSKKWRTAKVRRFGVTQSTTGRKSKPYELKRVGRLAIYNRVWARLYGDHEGRRPIHLMRRDEVRKEIRRLQAVLGFKDRMTISDSSLSELITQAGVAPFMEPNSNLTSPLATTHASFYGP